MSEALSGPSHPHQPGWFDLVSVLVEGMIANAGQEQAMAFYITWVNHLRHVMRCPQPVPCRIWSVNVTCNWPASTGVCSVTAAG